MKTLSRGIKFVILPIIALAAILTFRAFGQGPSAQPPPYTERKLVLTFAKETGVTNETAFKNALKVLGQDQYRIKYKHHDNTTEEFPPPPTASIKTDKVTASQLAKSAQAGELTPIGSNVTIKVTSNNSSDLTKVLQSLE
jgi:hypothetical protein